MTTGSSSDPPRPRVGALVARGREAEVFELGGDAVLKLYLDVADAGRAAREASVLRSVRAAGLSVPGVLDETVVDGRPGLVLERVPGADLLAALGRRPWTVLRAGPALARAQVAVNDVAAPRGLPSMKARLHDRIAGSRHLGDAERAGILGLVDAQADGDRLCHGDLHLENLLGRHDRPAVIDWSNAAAGPPAADVARTLVILQFGEPPPGAPVLVRRLAPVLRRLVVARYLATYRALRPVALVALDEWRVIQAAARLGETTQGESSHLRAWLSTRRPAVVAR